MFILVQKPIQIKTRRPSVFEVIETLFVLYGYVASIVEIKSWSKNSCPICAACPALDPEGADFAFGRYDNTGIWAKSSVSGVLRVSCHGERWGVFMMQVISRAWMRIERLRWASAKAARRVAARSLMHRSSRASLRRLRIAWLIVCKKSSLLCYTRLPGLLS